MSNDKKKCIKGYKNIYNSASMMKTNKCRIPKNAKIVGLLVAIPSLFFRLFPGATSKVVFDLDCCPFW